MKNAMDYTVEEIQNITDSEELFTLARNLTSRCFFYSKNLFNNTNNKAKCRELIIAVDIKLDAYWAEHMKGTVHPSK